MKSLPIWAAFLSLCRRKSKDERDSEKCDVKARKNLGNEFYVPSRAQTNRSKHVEKVDLWVRSTPDFEKFSGNSYENVDDFLVRFAQECDACDWDILSVIKAFPNHLTGDALNWYRRQPWPKPTASDSIATLEKLWIDIVSKLRSYFDNSYSSEQAKRSMAQLTQRGTESLSEFVRRFENLAQILGNDFDRYSTIRAKLNGLVCAKLDSLGITNYDQLVRRAKEVDERLIREYNIIRLAIAKDLHLEARPSLDGVPVCCGDEYDLYTTRNDANVVSNPEEWFDTDGVYEREFISEDEFDDFDFNDGQYNDDFVREEM